MKFTRYLIAFVLLGCIVISCSKSDDPEPVVPPPPPVVPAIGLAYAGGIIFYLDGTGQHGLVTATTDEKYAAEWGCEGLHISANGSARGTGPQNTTSIVNGCGTTGIAAVMCDGSVAGGYSDWYMPSKDELNLIYTNLYLKGMGGLSDGYYWSSTEEDSARAWFQFFDHTTGLQNPYNKHFQFYVRAVRVF